MSLFFFYRHENNMLQGGAEPGGKTAKHFVMMRRIADTFLPQEKANRLQYSAHRGGVEYAREGGADSDFSLPCAEAASPPQFPVMMVMTFRFSP